MVSFFRRKKPQDAASAQDGSTRRYSVEELAAAFPDARPATSNAADAAAALEQAREVADTLQAAEPAPAPITPEPQRFTPAAPVQPDVVVPGPSPQPLIDTPVPAPPVADAPVVAATPPAVAPAPAPAAAIAPPPVEAPVSAPDTAPRPTSIDKPAAAPGKPGWRERLRGSAFARSFGGLFSRNPKLDDDLLDEIETALITADVGVTATTALVESLRKRMKAREFADANALLAALRAELIAILKPVAVPLAIDRDAKPFVVLTVGVNGVGKTTTIGKLAKRFKDDGFSLMLAAGDTFRAAAVAQLQAWGERNGVTVVAQGQNADAASVAFDALQAGKARGTQVLIADTAGRLHTQTGLMNELGKIRRVLGKVDPSAPHEVLMVIDGTTGQNALSQLRQFHAAVGVTGLVVTKLDGTAKGGVVFALAREFNIPIRYAGIGERPEDLRVFDAEAFVDALLPEALGSP
ncbi:signal recognition particle-docking protein FtsY [Pseudoxanthomonas winnipegensis]|jgi:fused signal recognition particle receptor|uniref:Signal recognition particle receptor FtsY n=1 Tax=Pseudoxanthomonas winnipegensis TaxID=2480810 RepID=A0A4Q8L8G5_9GAMM|nr:signal recognition particle-docking protein FtsY [Pseudoxanthomonas winnipegensis]TAA24508.1 signal recognition particle-docking protein FtsY [Pseudoxanthomonas winnipegensis]